MEQFETKMDIDGKVVIITGAVGGIGFATVQYLLRNGAKYVALLDIHKSDDDVVIDRLNKLEDEFENESFGYYSINVANKQEFRDIYEKVQKLKSYVDVVINNAGVALDKDIDLTIDVNLKAVIQATMTATEYMKKGGVVVNIASFLGLINLPSYPVYNATKHGVVSFVRSMKEHNSTLGVRIVCICPGMTETNMTTSETFKNGTFDFVDVQSVEEVLSVYQQKPDNVASAILEIIKRGKEGDVWLAQNDEPAFNVGEETDLEKMRIPF